MTIAPHVRLEQYSGLLRALRGLGFELVHYSEEPKAFDNFYADFSDGKTTFRIVHDRSQLVLEGEKEALEPYGLWRAFDDGASFEKALLKWLRREV